MKSWWLVLPCVLAGFAGCQNATDGMKSAGGTSGATATPGAGAGGVISVPSEPGVTILQEDTLGFAAVDGKVLPREGSTSITGYTGSGFADGDPGSGTTISWSVRAASAGTYSFIFRYAFGGTETNLRDARLVVNGSAVVEQLVFPYTNTWNDWQETAPVEVELGAGSAFIQLSAVNESGLANIDYLKILGEGITPDEPSFTLTVDPNYTDRGRVSFAPAQNHYALNTAVALSAQAEPGYFFQSWSGDVTSTEPEHTFSISKNTAVTALFLPDGTVPDPELVGYASVQDDAGTPYIVTGGALGESVTATTLAELKTYLESWEPLVVSFSGLFEGTDAIRVASDKTLLGIGDSAHLRGIELEINGVRNVIVRNVAISHVVAAGTGDANDAIEITGGSKNVWIDHCELYSDLVSGEDYYDGLLEIKNAATFITVSWCEFHDHFKASLVSSGDEQVGDTAIRVTYHHNYFHECGSRMPSIRFGNAHIYDNYYQNNTTGSCVNTRMRAVVKVENNYFENSKNPIGFWDSPVAGLFEVSNNVFDGCTGAQPTVSTGLLTIPYDYLLDPTAEVPAIVSAGAGIGKL